MRLLFIESHHAKNAIYLNFTQAMPIFLAEMFMTCLFEGNVNVKSEIQFRVVCLRLVFEDL
jgi:hypothetical protein